MGYRLPLDSQPWVAHRATTRYVHVPDPTQPFPPLPSAMPRIRRNCLASDERAGLQAAAMQRGRSIASILASVPRLPMPRRRVRQ
jgi:uncharacterized protein (DUF2126 family)